MIAAKYRASDDYVYIYTMSHDFLDPYMFWDKYKRCIIL
jgi:hypothetical protein